MAFEKKISKKKKELNLSHLSIATWTIQGIKNTTIDKTKDEDFLREIRPHHIVGLTETHCTPGTILTIPGYQVVQSCRDKTSNKAHGGIAVLIKNEIRKGIKCIQANTRDTLWLCLKKEFFNTDRDLYIGTVYFSPINSSYSRKLEYNPFEKLADEIANYSEKGHTLLMGDFNARTKAVSDLVVGEECERFSPLRDVKVDEDIAARNSADVGGRVCSYGNQLIEMCMSANIKIVNGRVVGDRDGKYTCHTYNGSSVIDYIMVSKEVLRKVRYLKVNDLIGNLTDHCLVSAGISIPIKLHINTPAPVDCKPIPRGFKWHEQATEYLQATLRIDKRLERLTSEKNDNVENRLTALTNIIWEAASKCLVKKKFRMRKNINKKWFNSKCKSLKHEVKKLGKAVSNNPKDNNIRQAFNRTKKAYKREVKLAKLAYKSDLVKKLKRQLRIVQKNTGNC